MTDVLFALGEASTARERPMRIQLQKFVYLTDVLGQIVGALQPIEAHETYFNGPYDPAIQNAVDCLAFRELVKVADTWRTAQGRIATRYALTAAGNGLLTKLRQQPDFRFHAEIATLVGQHVNRLGWNRIVDLVYAEPTFVSARPRGYGQRLHAQDGLEISAAYFIAVIRRIARSVNAEATPSAEWIADRFFAYLDHYDRQIRPCT